MADAIFSFVEAMDRCWIERRLDDLSVLLRADIIVVSPDGATRVAGLAAAVENHRAFMLRAKIAWFASGDHVVTERGDAGIVEYQWDIDWRLEGAAHDATGARSWCLRDGMARSGSFGAPSSRARMRGLGKQYGFG